MSTSAALQENYNYGIPPSRSRNLSSSPLLDQGDATSVPIILWPRHSSSNSTSSVTRLRNTHKEDTCTSNKIDSKAIKSLAKRISSFGELKQDWDGYNGEIPKPSAIIDAIALVKMFPESELPERTGISSDGEISLFWEKKDLFADFGVDGDGTFTYFIKKSHKKYYGDNISLSCGIPAEALLAQE